MVEYKEVRPMAHGLLKFINPLFLFSPYPSHLIGSSMEQNALEKNGTSFSPTGPVITQPDSLLVVKFNSLNSKKMLQNGIF